ncbi:MAG TPA: pitrilysin family protein [Chryseosolibacter sp.]
MLDRTIAPPYAQDSSFSLITPRIKKLGNGIDLVYIIGGAQDVLKIDLVFRAGRWYETKWGAAYFTAHLLSKGTTTKSSFQIAQLFDLYGAHLEVSPGLDYVSVSLYSLTKNIQPVLSLLKELLLEPSFPEKELEQAISIYTQNLKINLEKTSFLASKHFRATLFGENHPYGKELGEADVKALTSADLQEYFSSFRDFTVFISGKIDNATEKFIDTTFQDFKKEAQQARAITRTPSTPNHQEIEKEGSVQASIRLGAESLLRTHPDYTNVIFSSHILGGYFGSRLMKNIREEKGLTYGIYAAVHPLKHAGYFVIGADVNKENISITFEEIRKELKRLRTEPVPADELMTAKNHFIGSLQSEITTPFAHADKIKTLHLSNLPADYYQQMIKTVKNITTDQIIATADKYLNEERFFELAVG